MTMNRAMRRFNVLFTQGETGERAGVAVAAEDVFCDTSGTLTFWENDLIVYAIAPGEWFSVEDAEWASPPADKDEAAA